MTAAVLSSPFASYGSDALPSRTRLGIFAGVLALHFLLFVALFYSGFRIAPERGFHSGAKDGRLAVFTLAGAVRGGRIVPGDRTGARPADADAQERKLTKSQLKETRSIAGERAGGAALALAIAGVLADDPTLGSGLADYRSALRRHIARHRQQPDRSGILARSGMVVVRFHIDRDGRIVDARVLQTQGARLDEAALQTLWRAEPLPAVPAGLSAPLEVDVPIDFRARA